MKTGILTNRVVQFAFAIAILILLVIGALSYRGITMSREGDVMVRHTHKVIEELQQLRAVMTSLESSGRGFVLTGDESYLDTYPANTARTQEYATAVRLLTADNPNQQQQLPSLNSLIAQKIAFQEMIIEVRRALGLNAAIATLQSGQGRQITTDFRAKILEMVHEEEKLLALRNAGAEANIRQTKIVLLSGTILGLLITGAAGWIVQRDNSKRGLMESVLRDREEQYRGLLEAAPDAMVVVNQAGEIILLNLQAEKQFGYRRDELVGQPVINIIPEGFAERLIADGTRSASEALAQQIGTGIELIGRRKDGSGFPIELMLSPLENADGILVTAAIRNISVRKDAEKHLAQMEGRYRGLLEAAPDAMVVVNQRGEIVLLNLQAEKQFGYHRDELVGQQVKNIIPEGFAERLIADGTRSAAEALAQQIGTGIELIARRKDGSEFPIELMLSPLENTDGILVTAAIRDISVRKNMEESLFSEKERAQVTLDSIGDAVISTDISGNITFFNVVAEIMTGWSSEEAEGRSVADVFRIIDVDSREVIPPPIEDAIAKNRTVRPSADCLLIRQDGYEIPVDNAVSPIHDRDGDATGAVIVCRDVGAARKMSLQITHSAEHDFLTGLPNRMLLNDRISQAIALAPRHNRQVAVLFMDLDNFKHINDSLGHSIGDKLLQSISKRLKACVRDSDTVSRQGGDEFVVLLSDAEQWNDAAIIARRILETVARPHSIDRHDLHITASIGVSVFPDDGDNAETLIMNADTAMYQAKENGRQGYQYFKPEMNIKAVERQSIEEGLRFALERQEFTLHYQPKVDLKTGAITGAEALIRWRHPTRGLVFPGVFIPVAEDCGLIQAIGKWVVREACTQAQAWVTAGLPKIAIAVNVSAMDLRDANFLDGLFATLNETGMDPKFLEVELTESVLMKHPASSAGILQTLREQGIKIAIDDFGTGYSSLSYLRKFPIDFLKIDQSFVRQITAVGEDTTIVTAIISMAQSLKLRVIAEGVETSEELAFLKDNHCDEAQGYLLSGPMPSHQFEALLRTGIRDPSAVVRPAHLVAEVATVDERDPPVRLSTQRRPDRAVHGQHSKRNRRKQDGGESRRRES